jgi:hypothetical protein
MALGSTQSLTEISTRNLPGHKGRLARESDNLTTICELADWKMWEPPRTVTGVALSFTLFLCLCLNILSLQGRYLYLYSGKKYIIYNTTCG